MMKHFKIFQYLLVLLASLALFSCEDRFDYSSVVIGDGESLVEATLTFKTNVANLGSRSSGTAISTIKDLQIVIYNADEKDGDKDTDATLYRLLKRDEVAFEHVENNTTTPDDYPKEPAKDENGDVIKNENGDVVFTDNDKTTEYSTQKVKVKNLALPYGRYYIYAVANLGRDLSDDEVATIDKLKSVQCEWDFDPMQYEYDREKEDGEGNPNDKDQINAQMFGYFTNIEKTESRNTNGSAFEHPEPAVVINQPSVNLHSWVKRLASKVTIAYDGRGLHNGVVVYIHNVSVRQIPYKCYLGKDNDPQGEDAVTPPYFDESIPQDRSSQALYYNSKGEITTYSEYDPTQEKGVKWMPVAKGTGIMGAKGHTNSDPALFFYENMKGVLPTYPKPQQPDSVGSNVGPDDPGYQDDVKYGTFIEVEAYYDCSIVPVSNGPIRYRFMLGQNIDDNYNAARNSHYKLTLGFRGYANQPDWHIEYSEPVPEIYAPPVYIPYTYNTAVKFPIRATGNPVSIDVELIENNWAPYDLDKNRVPNATEGTTNFEDRELQFNWWKEVYENNEGREQSIILNSEGEIQANYQATSAKPNLSNTSGNYLYGLHKSEYKYLTEEGEEVSTNNDNDYYHVTPIWAGFLRLLQPTNYEDENIALEASLYPSTGDQQSYASNTQLNLFRNYYIDCPDSEDGAKHLGKRTFNIEKPESDKFNTGRNAYEVIKEYDADNNVKGVSVIMNLWTQPKSMCGISGFSGNNPYEDYTRKAVIRVTAHYADGDIPILKKDVTIYQTERLVNPKAIWRSHELQTVDGVKDNIFNVILYKKDTDKPSTFEEVVSQGEWTASIKKTSENFDDFISIGTDGGTKVVGSTLSSVKFPIIFKGDIDFDDSKCAIIEITYHGNTCVHNIYVRQGFHQPLKISDDGPFWSAYNIYSCGTNEDSNLSSTDPVSVDATFTYNPVAFGSYFKRCNYYRAISAQNVDNVNSGFGPLGAPGENEFEMAGADRSGVRHSWNSISGTTDVSRHWANTFKVTQEIIDGTEIVDGKEVPKYQTVERPYRIATIADYEKLKDQEFGIGVMYGNGAKQPANTTKDAYGFLDDSNTTLVSPQGMRGIICYNPDNAKQIFFPVGTMGIGRRTVQSASGGYLGTLRYGALASNFSLGANTLRPVCYNISNASGSIYWANGGGNHPCWDMNYTDLNFNQYDGLFDDALPIRLVIDNLGN